jgi:predicted patatin/cPLA2 family phospholipase
VLASAALLEKHKVILKKRIVGKVKGLKQKAVNVDMAEVRTSTAVPPAIEIITLSSDSSMDDGIHESRACLALCMHVSNESGFNWCTR